MIHPTDHTRAGPGTVRDGQGAPIVCAACGCRLEAAHDGTWLHFGRFAGRDARGCRVGCVDRAHDRTGHPVVALTA